MKSNLDRRLTELESTQPVIKGISEDDPRVVAIVKKASKRLAELIEENRTGIKTHERLPPAERVQYLRERLEEAEYIVTHDGETPDDEINMRRMNEVTFRIGREIGYEVACEQIDELRRLLAAEQQNDRP